MSEFGSYPPTTPCQRYKGGAILKGMNTNTTITKTLKVITLALVLSFGLSYVYAWTAPTVTPPGGNTPTPLNVSTNEQTKSGDLRLGRNLLLTNNFGLWAKNTAGNDEQWMWPRASDNTMYTNFGTNGWNIRNNTSNNVMFMTNTGNVGIGTTNPTAKLDVEGTVKATGLQIPTNAAANKVLTSDASGNASWQVGGGGGGNVPSYNNLPSGALAGYCRGESRTFTAPGALGSNMECTCLAGFTSVSANGDVYLCIKN